MKWRERLLNYVYRAKVRRANVYDIACNQQIDDFYIKLSKLWHGIVQVEEKKLSKRLRASRHLAIRRPIKIEKRFV